AASTFRFSDAFAQTPEHSARVDRVSCKSVVPRRGNEAVVAWQFEFRLEFLRRLDGHIEVSAELPLRACSATFGYGERDRLRRGCELIPQLGIPISRKSPHRSAYVESQRARLSPDEQFPMISHS